jgi:hypothetical protein
MLTRNSYPGRSAARSGALQTQDRKKHRPSYDLGSAAQRYAPRRVRDTRSCSAEEL